MNKGFTLIELLIASAVAAILGTLLLMTYNQMNRSTQSIDNLLTVHERAVLFMQQFERDIQGAFIPWQDEEKKPAENGKKRSEKITHIFYSINKDKQLDLLTFITNNPLQMYWSERAGAAKPRIARVVYRLKESTAKRGQKVNSFVLVRQEGSDLNFQNYSTENVSAPRAYELIDGIKEMTVSFGAYLEKKSTEKNKKNGASQQSEFEYQLFHDWNMENVEKPSTAEKSAPERRTVPHEVYVTFSLWDAQKAKATTFSFACIIEPDLDAAMQVGSEQEPEKAENDAKKEDLFSKSNIQKLLSKTEQMLADLKKTSTT